MVNASSGLMAVSSRRATKAYGTICLHYTGLNLPLAESAHNLTQQSGKHFRLQGKHTYMKCSCSASPSIHLLGDIKSIVFMLSLAVFGWLVLGEIIVLFVL